MSNENGKLDVMMDEIVELTENGKVTKESVITADKARKANVISWGTENGVVIGTMADGTKVDIDGKII